MRAASVVGRSGFGRELSVCPTQAAVRLGVSGFALRPDPDIRPLDLCQTARTFERGAQGMQRPRIQTARTLVHHARRLFCLERLAMCAKAFAPVRRPR